MAHRYELEKYRKYGAGTNVLPVTVNGCLSGISIPQQGYLFLDVRRCNREDNCRYHYTPKEYFHDHPENDFSEMRRDNFRKDRTGYDTKGENFATSTYRLHFPRIYTEVSGDPI